MQDALTVYFNGEKHAGLIRGRARGDGSRRSGTFNRNPG
jgi:hypothetical protein